MNRPAKPGWRLPAGVGHPAEQLHELRDWEPDEDAPASQHVAWHDRQADLWDQIADLDATLADSARWLVDYHRRKAMDFRAHRADDGRRNG